MEYSDKHSTHTDDYMERRPSRIDEYADRRQSRSDDFMDDALLSQIDAFRDKARQLQTLITAKQSKVVSLEAMVREKEEEIADKQMQIQLLQEELADKQREADGLVSTVESQVDRMLRTMRSDFNDLGRRIEASVAGRTFDSSSFSPVSSDRPYEGPASVTADIDYKEIGYIVEDKLARQSDEIGRVVEEKLGREHDELGRMISRKLSEQTPVSVGDASGAAPVTISTDAISAPILDKMDQLSTEIKALKDEIDRRSEELQTANAELATANDEIVDKDAQIAIRDSDIEKLKKELADVIKNNFEAFREAENENGEGESLTEVKEELSEKIHAENVKVFRNIQDTLKEMDLKEEVDLSMEVRYRSLRNRLFWATSLLLINVGISIVLLLYSLQII